MSYHFGVDALSHELQNHKIWRYWIQQVTTTYTIILLFIYYITFLQIKKSILTRDDHAYTFTNEDLQFTVRRCIRTTEKIIV
ncbi:hypothetical protein LY90DRAFT_156908 [Neocallimastix californiae]|uniref:Uncharacterized protein n=1 Tax=Neocallimastix californiae TaxID=1754190 RepID=A0A1Y2FR47_9FUNG|nr:hypothetical protein LY90DRAFT_156908 [Neocallimastix californiae]|eukprot:ORY85794.1 hypothetical protein LY90DRAFT_156908 [Neocallimastix californiae]